MEYMKPRILVVDDSADLRQQLFDAFKREKFRDQPYEVFEAGDVPELKGAMSGPEPDVVLLDVVLPSGDGLTLLPQIKKQWPDSQVILMTGVLDGEEKINAAVEATKRGAFHFLSKPFNLANLIVTVERAIEHKRAEEERRALREEIIASGGIRPVFKSAAMQAVIATAEKIAASDASVLITGETGTGKEVICNAIHALSPRAKGPLVKVNCAALPRELIESELFGSVKGAYTGAHVDREGLFRQAEGGTLLLDEISEMPVDTQSKLLRVLQDKEVRPVGSKTVYKTDCRVVATTNRVPDEAIQQGKLREDLYHRISQITVHLPPLRERREDIQPLAEAFLKFFAAMAKKDITGFTKAAIERLVSFDWPGNVRQLQNEIQRAVLLCESDQIDAADLSIATSRADATQGDTNYTLLEGLERNAIIQMLKETGGNKLEAARRLGIGRQTLYNKIKAYGIEL